MIKRKLREWGKRYIPAEILCIISSVIVGYIIFLITQNRIATAYAASLAEAISYYSFLGIREYKRHQKLSLTIRNLAIEFGPAEIFDTFLIRAFFMYTMPLILGNILLGIIAGKIISDIIAYIIIITMYEIKKKYLK